MTARIRAIILWGIVGVTAIALMAILSTSPRSVPAVRTRRTARHPAPGAPVDRPYRREGSSSTGESTVIPEPTACDRTPLTERIQLSPPEARIPLFRRLINEIRPREQGEDLAPLLMEAIAQADESSLAAEGLHLLARYSGAEAQDYLLDRLIHGERSEFRVAAIRALGECADADYGAALLERTRPEERRVAVLAAREVALRTGDEDLQKQVAAQLLAEGIDVPPGWEGHDESMKGGSP